MFWAVAVDRKDDEKETMVNGHSNDDDYEPFEGKVVQKALKSLFERLHKYQMNVIFVENTPYPTNFQFTKGCLSRFIYQ